MPAGVLLWSLLWSQGRLGAREVWKRAERECVCVGGVVFWSLASLQFSLRVLAVLVFRCVIFLSLSLSFLLRVNVIHLTLFSSFSSPPL